MKTLYEEFHSTTAGFLCKLNPNMIELLLVLSGIKLNFFTVACMGQCFVFVLDMVLIKSDVSVIVQQYLLASRPLLLLTSPHLWGDRRCVQERLGGDTDGIADPSWPKRYPIPQKRAGTDRVYFCSGTWMVVSNYFLLHYLFFLVFIFLSPCCVFGLVVCF